MFSTQQVHRLIDPQSLSRCHFKLTRSSQRCKHMGCVAQQQLSGDERLGRRKCLLFASLAGMLPQAKVSLAAEDNTRTLYNKAAGDYDQLDGSFVAGLLGFTDLRTRLIGSARGSVLEVAVGTGLNLSLYNRQQITHYIGLDLSPGMLQQAKIRVQDLDLAGFAALQEGNVESLPFEDNSFDSVVSTYSLCVFQHPLQALKEMARVVKPNGKVLLLEHSKSNFGPLALYQDVTAEAVASTSKGCVWNQDVSGLLQEAGLSIDRLERHLGGLITLAKAHPSALRNA